MDILASVCYFICAFNSLLLQTTGIRSGQLFNWWWCSTGEWLYCLWGSSGGVLQQHIWNSLWRLMGWTWCQSHLQTTGIWYQWYKYLLSVIDQILSLNSVAFLLHLKLMLNNYTYSRYCSSQKCWFWKWSFSSHRNWQCQMYWQWREHTGLFLWLCQ